MKMKRYVTYCEKIPAIHMQVTNKGYIQNMERNLMNQLKRKFNENEQKA